MVAAVSPPALDKNWRRLGELIALSLCESARPGCRAIDVPPVKAESPRTDCIATAAQLRAESPRGVYGAALRSDAPAVLIRWRSMQGEGLAQLPDWISTTKGIDVSVPVAAEAPAQGCGRRASSIRSGPY